MTESWRPTTTPPACVMGVAGRATPWDQSAEVALRAVRGRPATLGTGRLLCVDGPAGSGKSSLAAAIAARAPGTIVVNTDQLLDGWDGLPTLPPLLAALVGPLAGGHDASYRRYDWDAGRYAEQVPVPVAPLLVIEGVGAGCRLLAPYRTLLVWVSAPDEQRRARVVERDGPGVAPYLDGWLAAEAAHFAAEGTRSAADLVIDTSDHLGRNQWST
jgi:uridine kinase